MYNTDWTKAKTFHVFESLYVPTDFQSTPHRFSLSVFWSAIKGDILDGTSGRVDPCAQGNGRGRWMDQHSCTSSTLIIEWEAIYSSRTNHSGIFAKACLHGQSYRGWICERTAHTLIWTIRRSCFIGWDSTGKCSCECGSQLFCSWASVFMQTVFEVQMYGKP